MPEKKINQIFKYILGSITIVAFATIAIYLSDKLSSGNNILGEQETQEIDIIEENDPYYISYSGKKGVTALELLREQESIITQESSFGEYVDEINGIKGGTDNKYWLFYVDGKMGEIGAGEYETNKEDLIEWRFE